MTDRVRAVSKTGYRVERFGMVRRAWEREFQLATHDKTPQLRAGREIRSKGQVKLEDQERM